MINNFEKWFTKTNESLSEEVPVTNDAATQTDITVSVDSGRKGIMSDVDAIMTSLDALSVELTESLNEDSLDALGALGVSAAAGLGVGAYKLYQWKAVAPKARKAQQKVNAINIKIAGLESQIKGAEPKVKEKVESRIEKAKEQRDAMQQEVNDKYGNGSAAVKNALAAEKNLGRMEVIKIELGDATPSQKQQLTDQAKKVKAAIAKAETEFKQAEPKATPEIKKEIEAAEEKQKEDKPEKAEETPAEETEKPADAKEDKLERVKDLISKEEERLSKTDSDESPKLDKLKEIEDDLATKENWQLENTELGRLLEMKINKFENDINILESISIKDKFSRLL